ncbi:hypothetical protein ANO11243_044610 [Dothideomycetidae sp. 11243]|nr:hypothetical protein ANO11243_044610 [fungal sp. No.11243]
MQSFLQYRKLGQLVRSQHGRAAEKVDGGAAGTSPHQAQLHRSLTGDEDPEKALAAEDSPTSSPDITDNNAAREAVEEPLHEEDEHGSGDSDDDHELHQYFTRLSQQRSRGTRLGHVLTGVNVRGYHDDNDPTNPHNWGYAKRIWVTATISFIGLIVGFASSIDSAAIEQASDEFGVSLVAESCATGLFLIGFGVGALFAGPFSETVGRNPVYIVTLLTFMIFVMASGLAPSIGAQLTFRFLAGVFGSTPLVCAGGSLADIWSPYERIYAFPLFANAAFMGPVLGPILGGYIAQPSSQLPAPMWRWCEWITLIISALVLSLVVLTLPETYAPMLLKWKAKHLRSVTGDDRYRAEIEVRLEPFTKRLGRALYRPFLMTIHEPIIMLVALYLTVIYIVLFTFLDGYTYIFQDIHKTSQGVTGLCFVGIIVGLCGISILVPFIGRSAKRNLQVLKEQGKGHLPPEFQLKMAMIGSPAIPISLFWMAWTSDRNISIWSPLAASSLFGFGILCVFVSCYQYIIDSYEIYAASALASITLIRYLAAGGMTIVGIPFYENLGVHYTVTILACISVTCVPVSYIFYFYGLKIRKRSKYAPTD